MKSYVVYWDGYETNVRHYFDTYEQAMEYAKDHAVARIRIAKVLAWGDVKSFWTEENREEVEKIDTFRKEYTPLDEEQKQQMAEVKDKAQELLELFNKAVPSEERSEKSRCMAVARTNLETTIMWAVKAVTTAKE